MEVLVQTDTDDIKEELTADNRGRVTLGKAFANETVSIAVVDREERDGPE